MTQLDLLTPAPSLYADGRTVLLAMNNPISGEPEHALYPHPPGCAGHRLCDMLWEAAREAGALPDFGVCKRVYLRRFDRRNLLSAREWSARDARAAAGQLLPQLLGRRVVVLGVGVLDAMRLSRPTDWGRWVEEGGMSYTLLPHPSGRCREYNDPEMRRLAGRTLLTELTRIA